MTPSPSPSKERLEQDSASTQIPAELQTNKFDLGTVTDAIPGFVWTALPNGELEFCSRALLDYAGRSLVEFRREELAAAIHPLDKAEFSDKWRAALTQPRSFETEARMRRADGCYRWFLIRAVALREANGGISRWCGTNFDIEDLKCAQMQLQEKNARLDQLFEEAPEGVAILSMEERVVRINKEFGRMFGYEPDEVLERRMQDLIVPETLLEGYRGYLRQVSSGHRVEVETVRRRKDSTEVHVSLLAAPITSASGEPVGSYVIYRDITGRKRAEEQLFESEARFRMMADTAPVLIWMTGTDGLCNYFNKPWLEFTGRSMEQEVGLGWTEGVHPDDVQGCFDGFLPAFHARKPFRMEYRLRRADGEYRWVIESGIPRYTGGGEFAGYIGSNIDITDLKGAEQERERLRQLQTDLARVNRVTTMGELTASLAHEVNQPIAAAVTSANSCLHWLAAEVPNLDKARAAAERIVKDGSRAAEIVSRIRLLFQKGNPQEESVDINEVIEEMIALLRGETTRYSISVRTALDADLPQVLGDRVQLQQVMMNLITNSIDAMKTVDGTREVAIASQRTENQQLLVAVNDTGVGLPTEQADQIFNAFFTTKPHGTGMGLRICRTIVESHGGRLWAAGNSPRGASFYVSLPTKAEPRE